MPCNTKPTHCAPCGDCPPPPDPLLPRCDVLLDDGVFTNATVVVEQGCITSVQEGEPFVYQPTACCGGGGSGGGTGPRGPQGDPGPAGQAATITVSATNTIAPGLPASVVNVGTPNMASLVFNIPRGADGAAGGSGGSGLTFSGGNWSFVDGSVVTIPPVWPPVVMFNGTTDHPSVLFTGTIDNSGTLNANLVGLQMVVTSLTNLMDSKDLAVTSSLQSQIDTLQAALTALDARVTACACP